MPRIKHLNVPLRTLQISVAGAGISILEGIDSKLWTRVQQVHIPGKVCVPKVCCKNVCTFVSQVVVEVENFKAMRQVREALELRGFAVTDDAWERRAFLGSMSETTIVCGVRQGYAPPVA